MTKKPVVVSTLDKRRKPFHLSHPTLVTQPRHPLQETARNIHLQCHSFSLFWATTSGGMDCAPQDAYLFPLRVKGM